MDSVGREAIETQFAGQKNHTRPNVNFELCFVRICRLVTGFGEPTDDPVENRIDLSRLHARPYVTTTLVEVLIGLIVDRPAYLGRSCEARSMAPDGMMQKTHIVSK